ncbi:hypothetical protein [Burkholderia sp. EMB26]|uniref:hypothetical protein n=1 Tax=Burkholderia sp. EMB26 TaxID=2854261 RepID=UPI00215A70FA|nr:hypothetical protein [Burkholderia sp. EMB26]UVE57645.1 hypothetical protein KU887_19885 [Burkholderia sp. EMB26]
MTDDNFEDKYKDTLEQLVDALRTVQVYRNMYLEMQDIILDELREFEKRATDGVITDPVDKAKFELVQRIYATLKAAMDKENAIGNR